MSRRALKRIRELRHSKDGRIFGRRRGGGPLSLYAVREHLERACRRAEMVGYLVAARDTCDGSLPRLVWTWKYRRFS